MKSAPTITFDYRPSPIIGRAVALIGVAAVMAIGMSDLTVLLRLVLLLPAISICALALRRHFRPSIRRIAWRASGWTLLDTADQEHAAVLCGHSRLGRLIVLQFRYGLRRSFRPLITPDNLHPDTHRRLLLMLARGDVVHVG